MAGNDLKKFAAQTHPEVKQHLEQDGLESGQKKREDVMRVFLFLATAAAFHSSLHNNFVAWDDNISIYQNRYIQGLDVRRLWWMFTNVAYALRYKPFSWLCYALIYAVNGLNPFGFHLVGLLFHCSNAVLLYAVLRKLLAMRLPQNPALGQARQLSLAAGLGTLLWAVHPLRTEAVAWATAIDYDQSLFFILISLLCYFKAVARGVETNEGKKYHWRAVIAFALGMLTYPVVAGYAAVLVILDFYPLRLFNPGTGWWRDAKAQRIWLSKLPFILVAGGVLLVTILGRLNPSETWAKPTQGPPFSVLERTMQAFYVWAYYLWKPWVPFNLSPIYATLVNFNPLSWPFVTSAIAVISLTALFIWKRRVWRGMFALWMCHLVLLVPLLGLMEHVHFTSDRYSYVVGILWSVVISAGLAQLLDYPRKFILAGVGGLALAGMLCVMSTRQTKVWRDSVSLFTHMIAKLGNDPYREDLILRLGLFYLNFHQTDAALKEFREGVSVNPNWPDAHNLLGNVLMQKGQLDEASTEFREALRLAPAYVDAHKNLGDALLKQGHLDEAIDQFQDALKLEPNNSAAREGLSAALTQKSAH